MTTGEEWVFQTSKTTTATMHEKDRVSDPAGEKMKGRWPTRLLVVTGEKEPMQRVGVVCKEKALMSRGIDHFAVCSKGPPNSGGS